MDEKEAVRKIVDDMSKEALRRDKLIELGWMSLRRMTIPPDVSQEQLHDMRYSFFAGAQHLFGSIMSILEPGAEPTENDLSRLSSIQRELALFEQQVKAEADFARGPDPGMNQKPS